MLHDKSNGTKATPGVRPERAPLKISRYTMEPSPAGLSTVREFVKATLRPVEPASGHLDDIVSATHEACKNALVHNPETGSPIDIVCKVLNNSVVVEVIDRGSGFAPGPTPPIPPEPEALRGRGIFLIHCLMDNVETSSGSGGTRITMEKAF